MLVRQKIGRYAGRVFDMQIAQAINNQKAGVVEFVDPMPISAADRLQDAGLIERAVQPEIQPVVRRGRGRPRTQKPTVSLSF